MTSLFLSKSIKYYLQPSPYKSPALKIHILLYIPTSMDHPVTLQEQRKVWTIHQSVNGTTYYYNRATKKSQYEMPECFKTTEEVLEHPDWKEYRTAEGKKFYYNATNRKSCWQLPNEVKEYRIKLEEKRRKDREEGRVVEQEQLSETQEIKRKFMSLLRQKLIAVSTKWDSCIKLCEDDPRWQLLKISDKKKYFNEYVGELRKISDQQKRAKTEVNKNQFLKMLRENKTLTSDCKMHKVAYDFLADPRWRLLEEHERENTFQSYLDELAQKEKDEALRLKREACEALRAALEADGVRHNAKWDDIRSSYKTLPEVKELHAYDRISTFIDYILEAEKKHEEETAKERRLRERVNRLAFRQLLREKLLSGELPYKMRWREFCTEFRNEKSLLGMLEAGQTGSSAQQIFEHFMWGIREKHKLIKGYIKHHFKRSGFKMSEETANEEFRARLADLPEFAQLRDYEQDYFHRYFLLKLRSRRESKAASTRRSGKRERKAIFKIFKSLQSRDLLKNKYMIEEQMGEVERSMKEQGHAVTHEAIFKLYLAFLERNDQEGRDPSKSSHSSSPPNHPRRHKRKLKVEEMEEEVDFSLRKFSIPELNELKQQQLNEAEEEGEIKDEVKEEEADPQPKKPKGKKKKRSSSSDSD